MKIRNELPNPVFFGYAGSGRRGVEIKPGELSPDITVGRITNARLQKDLANGRVSLVLTAKDKNQLKGHIDDKYLGSEALPDEIRATPAEPDLPPAPPPTPPEPPAHLKPAENNGPDHVVEKDAPEEPAATVTPDKPKKKGKKDAVADEYYETLKNLSEEGRAEYLARNLMGSVPDKKAAITDALKRIKAEETTEDEPADEATDESSSGVSEDDSGESAEAESDGEGTEDAPAAEEASSDEPVSSDEPAASESSDKPYISKMTKPQLLAEATDAGLDANPAMTVKDLRVMIREHRNQDGA